MQRWRRQIGAKVVTEHFSHFDSSAKPQKIPNKLDKCLISIYIFRLPGPPGPLGPPEPLWTFWTSYHFELDGSSGTFGPLLKMFIRISFSE